MPELPRVEEKGGMRFCPGVWCGRAQPSCRLGQRPGQTMSRRDRGSNPSTGLSQGAFFPLLPSQAHPAACAQPIPAAPSPSKLNQCLTFPAPHPCSPPRSIVYLNGAGEQLRLRQGTRQAHPAGQMCWHAWGAAEAPGGALPCQRGRAPAAQCSAHSGGISGAKSVTVRRVCTVNHSLIKLLSL